MNIIIDLLISVIILAVMAMMFHIYYLNRRLTKIRKQIADEEYYVEVGNLIKSQEKEAQLRSATERAHTAIEKGERMLAFGQDLRPVLAGLVSDARQLASEELTGDSRQVLSDKMMATIHQLTSSIEKVLYMARIDSDSIVYDSQQTLVDDIVKEIYEQHKEDSRLHFLPCSTSDVHICCDAFHLKKAVEEILENALHFSSGGDILIGWFHHLDDNEVEIYIEDHGIGIDAAHLPRIYDAFYKVDEKSAGAGLGLTIARSLVEKWAGRINIISRKGFGTRCGIIFPTV